MLLDGKVAIVTGASQGIGRACAERLAREGARLVLCDVTSAQGQSATAAIANTGAKAVFAACDVSKASEVSNAVTAALDAYGRIDVLVNNAGVLDDAPFLDLAVDEFDRIIGVNLRGAFLMGQAVARQMVKQGVPDSGSKSRPQAGAIVNMSSVNAVGPGTIQTPLLDGVIKDTAFRTKVLSRTPIGRFGQPDEVAAIVAWLASEESSYVTGTTVYADGGRLPLNYVVPVRE
jgi:NAD(P)-dependent dehydrogenase (short-subunit alcohol dehydrogenase family)